MPQNPVITKQAMSALNLLKNGSYSNEGVLLNHTLYDTLTFAATTVRATSTFFGVGTNGATKTLTETNVSGNGQLPNAQAFLINGMSLSMLFGAVGADTDANTVLAAAYNVIQNSVFEIKIQGRDFDLQKPGTEFLPPYALSALNSAANGNFPHSSTQVSGCIKFAASPIPIGNLVGFNVLQRTGSVTTALQTIINTASDVLNTQNAQLQVRLHGYLVRSI